MTLRREPHLYPNAKTAVAALHEHLQQWAGYLEFEVLHVPDKTNTRAYDGFHVRANNFDGVPVGYIHPEIPMTKTKADYIAIHRAALEAARQAVAAIAHEEGTRGFDCGFAWVQFSGADPFGRAVRQEPEVSKGYPNGLQVWNPGCHRGQSIHIIEAGARAYNEVLKDNNIANATVGSRYD